MALFHHALFWAAAVVAQSYDIAQGLAWSWPLGSFLRLAEERHLNYQRATVSAGKEILGLEITIPNYQCVAGLGSFGDAVNSENKNKQGRTSKSIQKYPKVFESH